MPIIDEETRQRIKGKMARRAAIEAKFKTKFTDAARCRLCGWYSNGRSFDEALEANYLHERAHPEYQEWVATSPSLDEVRASLHDHECHSSPCACKCGCRVQVGCVEMGALCAVCEVAAMRGHAEHGEKE